MTSPSDLPEQEYQRGWNAGWTAAIRSAHGPCTCREFCGDTPEGEGGTCKGLRRGRHPGEFETRPTMARLAWRLRVFCIRRLSDEVVRLGNRAVASEGDRRANETIRLKDGW